MKINKKNIIISIISILIGFILTLSFQELTKIDTSAEKNIDYTNHQIIFYNNNPEIYQSIKYYINDVPIQNFELTQKKTKSLFFYAPEQFTLKAEFNGFAKPVTIKKTFYTSKMTTDRSWCKEGLKTIAPIEIIINDKDNISVSIGEDVYECPF